MTARQRSDDRSSAWRRYADAKAAYLAANPGATADELEAHARRLIRREGL